MKALKSFLADVRGNTASMLALSVVPMVLGAGAAMDYGKYADVKTVVQAATDAAALSMAKSRNATDTQIQTLVDDYVAANSQSGALDSIVEITPVRDLSTGKFSLQVKGKMKTSFMFLAGISEMDVEGYAEVETGGSTLEVVLVLDNTGSMNSNGRLAALKTAAKSLVDILMQAKAAGADVKVSIVPFAEYVNVGVGNRNESWIDVPPDTSTPYSYCSNTYPDATKSNCRMEPWTRVEDGLSVTSMAEVCDWDYGAPVEQCYSGNTVTTWQGCVGSRGGGKDVSINSHGHKYEGVMNVNCPQPIQDLTGSESTLDAKIDAMVGSGNTYIAPGLVWGWNILDDSKPMESAKSKSWMRDNKGTKAIVLMTDGDNTKSPTYPYHNGTDVSDADAKTTALCNNIKSDEIVMYTVALEVTTPSSLAMLQNCATTPAHSFEANNPATLLSAFDAIGEELTSVRLVK
jgi:Flp pilus assembly protein TadG